VIKKLDLTVGMIKKPGAPGRAVLFSLI